MIAFALFRVSGEIGGRVQDDLACESVTVCCARGSRGRVRIQPALARLIGEFRSYRRNPEPATLLVDRLLSRLPRRRSRRSASVFHCDIWRRSVGVKLARKALGATPGAVTALLLPHGLALAIFGSGAGRAGAWRVGGLLSKQLYEIAPTDLATFGISLLLLIAVATLACC
jgi:hypothetical protein